MAHFAEIGSDKTVLRVVVVNNTETLNEELIEQESVGAEFCRSLFGGDWLQTSYNGNFRKNFAAKGYTYDSERDAFIPPKVFDSWLLDEDTCSWVPPVAMPEGGKYLWDEETTNWVAVE